MDEGRIDRQLVEVFGELITLVQDAKQAAWQISSPALHRALEDLRRFVGTKAVEVGDAEAALGGRSPDLVSPTGRSVRNVRAEAGDAPGAVADLVVRDVRAVADDVRARAQSVDDAPTATLFREVADGLDDHAQRLVEAAARDHEDAEPTAR
jgi:DNA-binding ferritin-like protein